MKKFSLIKIISCCILMMTFVLACQKEVGHQGTIVATVNNEILTFEMLKAAFTEEVWNEKSLDDRREIINQWIDLTVMSWYAFKNDELRESIHLQFLAESAKKRIYSNALIANELQRVNISNEEKFNYFRLRQTDFIEPIREFSVQRIFLRTEEEMIRVNDMITNREIEYTPAARQYSQEGIGRNGGHMSTLVTRSGPDSLLWRELNQMERFHRVTMPYNNGWLIARWGDYRMATGNRSFFDVREEIEHILRNEKRVDIFEQLLQEARNLSQITIEY